VARETGRSGLKAAVMYHPSLSKNADTTAFSRMILKGLQINGIQLLDVVTMTETGPNYWYSYRINGVIDFSGDVEETGPNWMMAKEPAAEYEMHGTAARVATAEHGESVVDRPGSYYAPVSFTDAAAHARTLSMAELQGRALSLDKSLEEHQVDMGAIAGAEAFNRLHAAVVQAAQGGDGAARAQAVAERDAWLDHMNKIGMTAARILSQFRYLKAGMPGAQIAIIERQLKEKGLVLRDADRKELESAILEDAKAIRELEKAAREFAADPSDATAAARDAAEAAARVTGRKRIDAMRIMPRSLADDVVFAMQMNLMTSLSLLGNVAANIMFAGPELAARQQAALVDRLVSAWGGRARIIKGVSGRELKAIGATLRGSGKAIKDILRRGDAGDLKAMGEGTGREWRPLKVWAEMMAGKMVRDAKTGRIPKSEVAARLLEGTSGLAATPIARGLKVGDFVFSAPAEAAALVQIGELMGLEGAALESFLANPPKEARAEAHKEALRTVFQESTKVSGAVNHSLNTLKNWGIEGQVGYVALRTVIPFYKTPLNIGIRSMQYVPVIGMLSVVARAREGDAKGVRLGLARQVVGAQIMGAVGFMAAIGVLFGMPDDEKKRSIAQGTTGTNRLNLAGLRRALARMAAGNWDIEAVKAAAQWKPGDETMGFNYMGMPGLFASMAANTKLAVESSEDSKNPFTRDRSTLTAYMVEASLNVPNAMIEMAMMKGAYTALDAFAKKRPKKLVANMVTTVAGVGLPRTIEAAQDAIWTWAPETSMKHMTTGEMINAALVQRIPSKAYGELPVKRDYFGRPVRNVAEGVNPWLAKMADVFQSGAVGGAAVDRELADVFNDTADVQSFPSIPERYYTTKDGRQIVMTVAEWSKHIRNVGAARLGILEEQRKAAGWAKLPADAKLRMLTRIYDSGDRIGKFMSERERESGSIPWSQIPKSIQSAWTAAATY
jgi:hypothetical protein